MADETPNPDETPITFNVKASEAKYVLTIPLTTTVSALKEKLSSEDYSKIPAARQRLIYSGRVLKDGDTLASYKVKEGNTVHLVKSAESNQSQNPSSSGGTGTDNATPAVPQMAAGTGRDPLAALTGARYAGYAQMPNVNMFGPDGGVSRYPLSWLPTWLLVSRTNMAMIDGPAPGSRTYGVAAGKSEFCVYTQ